MIMPCSEIDFDIDSTYSMIYGLLHKLNAPKHLIDDFAQESMIKAWTNRNTIDPRAFKSWLYRVVKNTVYDHYRKRREVHLADVDVPEPVLSSPTLDRMIQREEILIVQGIVQYLPEAQRDVLNEVYFKDNSREQTGKKLGISEGTVHSRMHYAIKNIRSILKKVA